MKKSIVITGVAAALLTGGLALSNTLLAGNVNSAAVAKPDASQACNPCAAMDDSDEMLSECNPCAIDSDSMSSDCNPCNPQPISKQNQG